MIHIPKIHDRGRGPEIEGTRITVYDVMDYYCEGWPATRIAVHLGLGTPAHWHSQWHTITLLIGVFARGTGRSKLPGKTGC